ncbi:MAG TPA: lysophospholipid acyltransferase family protein [Steroidobacteraceae bacterium]|nr:lysophospholipid acyltransferase family protein [Steroidobacteraceae bacterium]
MRQKDPPTSATQLPWWLRALSRLPWSVLYACAAGVAWLAHRVLRYRLAVVRANVAGSFPELSAPERRAIERDYYARLGELLAEIVKSATLTRAELERRVQLRNFSVVRDELHAGRSVLLVAAHQCNWEWMLLALSLQLGAALEAAYKPLHAARAERLMRALRTRFGGLLVPAKDLLASILRTGKAVRAIAMVADQEPVTSDYKWWTQFLHRPTAFYMGPEKIAQVTRYAVVFVAARRLARGHYEIAFEPIAAARETLTPGDVTERYARLVEAQICASPADWTWSHRRWKLRRPMYSGAADELDAGRAQ